MTPPELAAVVLSLGNPPELPVAVRSLAAQPEPLEIVVVNSGGGGAAAQLAAEGLGVPVIERGDRLLPGAARNVGVAVTRAPFVAFLAADCVAEPGWAAARIEAHRCGAAAVASAVTNPYQRSVAAWTSYVALFNRRMPGVPAGDALLYGVSYARALFDRFGPFREDLRGGEDTDFHRRLAGRVAIAWEPRVRTAHRHPTTFRGLLRDQFRRGARSAAAWEVLGGPASPSVARNALRRIPEGARFAWRAAGPGERPWIAAAVALLPLSALAYAVGSLAGGRAASEES